MNKSSKSLRIIGAAALVLLLIQLPAYSFPGRRSNYSVPEGIDLTGLTLKDGTYEGTATGFREGLVVEITIDQGKLTMFRLWITTRLEDATTRDQLI